MHASPRRNGAVTPIAWRSKIGGAIGEISPSPIQTRSSAASANRSANRARTCANGREIGRRPGSIVRRGARVLRTNAGCTAHGESTRFRGRERERLARTRPSTHSFMRSKVDTGKEQRRVSLIADHVSFTSLLVEAKLGKVKCRRCRRSSSPTSGAGCRLALYRRVNKNGLSLSLSLPLCGRGDTHHPPQKRLGTRKNFTIRSYVNSCISAYLRLSRPPHAVSSPTETRRASYPRLRWGKATQNATRPTASRLSRLVSTPLLSSLVAHSRASTIATKSHSRFPQVTFSLELHFGSNPSRKREPPKKTFGRRDLY